MSPSTSSMNSRWITTLPLLLVPLVAAAPLPNDSTATTAVFSSSSSMSYPMITNSGTTSYTSSSFSTATATPTATLNSFEASSASDMNWDSYPTSLPTQIDQPSMVPVIIQPGDTSNDAYALSPTPTASWALPPNFSDMSSFQVTTYAAGKHNMAILQGSPASASANSSTGSDNSESFGESSTPTGTSTEPWDPTRNALQILYPSGSVNPGNSPQGGAEFYAIPLPEIKRATNASLEYSVYFPPAFDFVKGGKLPGLYGGHKGCSGGNAAEDCFSTRLMWRAGGQGELYLYAPKDKQTPELCQTPPISKCDAAYGLSIGRGSWKFALGDWTKIRQDIWLNTPGQNDGGFNIWINDKLILNNNAVRYRENGNTCLQGQEAGDIDDGDVGSAMINTIGFGDDTDSTISSIVNEDWQVSENQLISTSTSTSTNIISTVTVTATLPPISAYSTPYSYFPTSTSTSAAATSSISATSGPTSTFSNPSSTTSASTSSSSATSSGGVQKRNDEPTSEPTPTSQVDTGTTQHALVITIPITDSITTVTATATATTTADPLTTTEVSTAFITVPTTVLATSTVLDQIQMTITPSASTDTVFNTVYVTETKDVAQLAPAATAAPTALLGGTAMDNDSSAAPAEPQPSGQPEFSNKSIMINKDKQPSQPIVSFQSQPQSQMQPNIDNHKVLQPIILKSPSSSSPKNQTNTINSSSNSCDGGVGFLGLFFSTFFGGHDQDWASPRDQYTYFREFKMWVNN